MPSRRDALANAAAAVLLALFAAWYAPTLGTGFITHTDEFATLDRSSSMLTTGDWATVHSRNLPSFKKPPLQYWMGAALMNAGMDLPAALRLPSLSSRSRASGRRASSPARSCPAPPGSYPPRSSSARAPSITGAPAPPPSSTQAQSSSPPSPSPRRSGRSNGPAGGTWWRRRSSSARCRRRPSASSSCWATSPCSPSPAPPTAWTSARSAARAPSAARSGSSSPDASPGRSSRSCGIPP